jgi:hypothetical protein
MESGARLFLRERYGHLEEIIDEFASFEINVASHHNLYTI